MGAGDGQKDDYHMRNGMIGALANMPSEVVPQSYGYSGSSGTVGSSMHPQPTGAQIINPEEFEQRREQNRSWLQDPKTQAALLGFAASIMQPLGSGAGIGDFVGALGQAGVAGAQAAAGVDEAEQLEAQLAQENSMKQRQMGLQERRFGLEERELGLREQQLMMEQGGGTAFKQAKVVSGDDPINQQFQLGIPKGSHARVEITYNTQTGQPIGATVESQFGTAEKQGFGGSAGEIADLYTLADQYEAAGMPDRAQIARNRAYQLGQEFSLSTGEVINAPAEQPQVQPQAEPIGSGTITGQAGVGAGAEASLSVMPEGTEPGTTAGIVPQAPVAPAAMPVRPAPPPIPDSPLKSPAGPIITAIPGGKVDRESQAAKEQQEANQAKAMADSLAVTNAVTNIRQAIKGSWAPDHMVTGFAGPLLAAIPGTASRQVAADLDVLKANTGFQQLQVLRESSPTGGALGPVSDAENKLLQSTRASLDQFRGTPEQLEAQILTLQFLFDPAENEKRRQIAQQVSDGSLDPVQGMMKVQQMLDNYIYPPELNQPQSFDMSSPPDYVPAQLRKVWYVLDTQDKLELLNEEDRRWATGELR